MIIRIPIGQRSREDVSTLLTLWEQNVRETHLFLSEENIRDIYSSVREGLLHIQTLLCLQGEHGKFIGFLGLEKGKIEMFFIDTMQRNKGYGGILLQYAIDNFSVKFVDVNEQNMQALLFYQHRGFRIFDRSEVDSDGRFFPLLHMSRGVERE